jgi:uncharacterized membrane protein YccC
VTITPDPEPASAYLLTQDDLDRLPTVRIEPRERGLPVVSCGHDGVDENLDALRAEVARLQAGWDDSERAREVVRRERVRAENERDEAREHARRLFEEMGQIRQQLAEATDERDAANAELARKAAGWDALAAEGRQQVARLVASNDQLRTELEACRAQQSRQAQTIAEQRAPGDLDGDPRRPHLDAWPDDAVLLRYRELRDLVALHLDRYADGVSARAMRDGDVPLRLAEVLRP